MRTILYILLLLSFVGCQKEDVTPEGQLQGTWLFKEGKYGTGRGAEQHVTKADPLRPVQLVFRKDGTFSIDVQPRLSAIQYILQEFNRYELLPDNVVRFYNTSNGQELTFDVELGKELALGARYCREGCIDYFIKKY